MKAEEQWCGKKYKIYYASGCRYKYVLYPNNNVREKVIHTELKLINYDSPFTGRFFFENENGGLEIIPMESIIEMREIEKENSNNEI